MVNPDLLVAAKGESVSLIHVTVAVYDGDDFDDENSTIPTTPILAIVSLPSEKDLRAFQGRQALPTLRLTVLSTTDIKADRPGRNDRIERDGHLYQVEEVRSDRHPFVGVPKKTVFLTPLPGR